MAEATYEAFIRATVARMCDSLDLSYEEVMAERDRDERERLRRIWRKIQAGEPECADTCLRADEARRKA